VILAMQMAFTSIDSLDISNFVMENSLILNIDSFKDKFCYFGKLKGSWKLIL
jgi:hypothetical protein